MLFLSPCLTGAALRPAVRRDTRLLGLVAASAADSISSFAKSQLAGTGELLVDPGEELADPLEELKQQQREARRLRRSWDSRLSWRLRKQKAAAAAAAAAAEEEAALLNAVGGPSPWQRAEEKAKAAWWLEGSVRAVARKKMRHEPGRALRQAQQQPEPDGASSWTPALGTAAVFTAAAVMQAAESLAVAAIHQSEQQQEAAAAADGARPTWAPWPTLETAAAVSAATVMQVAEMAGVAAIRAAGMDDAKTRSSAGLRDS